MGNKARIVQGAGWTLLQGHTINHLNFLGKNSTACVVTSPPYFQTRNYGGTPVKWQDEQMCSLGQEPSVEEYVLHLSEVLGAVRNVLRPEGTVWLNLGDSYATTPPGNPGAMQRSARKGQEARSRKDTPGAVFSSHQGIPPGYKRKDLLLIPHKVAQELQARGWFLRADIVWAKATSGQHEALASLGESLLRHGVNADTAKKILGEWDLYTGGCLPENTRDRPYRAHEYIFLLAKQAHYFANPDGMMEPGVLPGSSRMIRSVWTIPVARNAHPAAFPEELARRCILAGSAGGDTVLDPFCGSGTVGVVARQLGRKFIGMDLDIKLAQQRLSRA